MRKKKPFRIGLAGLLIVCLAALTGCTLAKEENPESLNAGLLCGALITMGRQVDTSIPEGVTFQNADELVNYDHSREIAGVRQEDGSYAFEGVNGSFIAVLNEYTEINGIMEPHSSIYADSAIQNPKFATNSTEQGEEYALEGTVMISRFSPEAYYVNPVYRNSDGSVYVKMGATNGLFVSPGSSAGIVSTQTVKEERVLESEGKTASYSMEIKVNYKVITGIKKAVIKEMNAFDELLIRHELKKDETDYRLSEETAYFIIEETEADQAETVKRSIYTVPSDSNIAMDAHSFYYLGEKDVIDIVTLNFNRS